ncbi:hypothetical protein KL905_005196 [Ogataea polymorpha]|uniref:Uncharacterized protein n=1 Tax=Ogataea polymorpha TaxID=460523 RepID=A0A1B7SBI1_9ASCO|nr:uncharacterized protein OGAPODRAFT_10499 [Ogataea polymorpha]KAG7876907.1 hypothetical protein KL937_005206 [Ogataea polymorpha]KAG7897388.1 hypothetical protein KL935_005197 [Ogataea polymorpha]KAG7898486.1 hypothetical protein KL907_005246 [Ogataea polymorpha]KAG7914912.1 hypothetical protein KL905_005196 [Ogataea polymorpha]KAG7929231.1 hypothetical protein KL934_005289 [Ogataea polymorpha]
MSSFNQIDPSAQYSLRCPFCLCKIISSTPAKPQYSSILPISTEFAFVDLSPSLEISSHKADHNDVFFHVGSMWDFDNIGVSRPSSELAVEMENLANKDKMVLQIARFLTCADCDKGPLGFAARHKSAPPDKPENGENLIYFLRGRSCLYDTQ